MFVINPLIYLIMYIYLNDTFVFLQLRNLHWDLYKYSNFVKKTSTNHCRGSTDVCICVRYLCRLEELSIDK